MSLPKLPKLPLKGKTFHEDIKIPKRNRRNLTKVMTEAQNKVAYSDF